MFQFIESIRVNNRQPENLHFHQLRMNKTLMHYGKQPYVNLIDLFDSTCINNDNVIKWRIVYSLEQIIDISYTNYSIKTIDSVALVNLDGQQYDFKFEDRGWITSLLNTAGTDEIIMCADGVVKDASYANILFFDGANWYTPEDPLLDGTRRAQLLIEGKIQLMDIRLSDLKKFDQVKFINALMCWEESPTFQVARINMPTV